MDHSQDHGKKARNVYFVVPSKLKNISYERSSGIIVSCF